MKNVKDIHLGNRSPGKDSTALAPKKKGGRSRPQKLTAGYLLFVAFFLPKVVSTLAPMLASMSLAG